jgi:antitoxin (DNA-binding transcriptional repressor) of toxin-antitoxin stability system
MSSIRSRKAAPVGTLVTMTEIPENEVREHFGEVVRRVEAGEEVVVTVDGHPVIDLRRHQDSRPISWDRFWATLEQIPPDPAFAADIRDLVADDTTDDSEDPRR